MRNSYPTKFMHIQFISSSTGKFVYTGDSQCVNDIVVHLSSMIEAGSDNRITPDIIFFDAGLGEESILQSMLHYQQPDSPLQWLVTNLEHSVQQSLQYLQSGASGILTQSCDAEKLQKIIHYLAKDQIYLDDDLTQTLAIRQLKKVLTPFSQLTAREFDVFCLLAEGFFIPYIAEALSISTKTVFNCQAQLRKKLSVKNQQQTTQLAKKHRLIF